MNPAASLGARLRAAGLLATAPVVALLAPSPSTAWTSLSDAQHPAAPLVGLVALAAWASTTWLTLLVVLTWGTHVPGALGRVADRVAVRLAPSSVRGMVRVAVGTTLALSVLGGSSSAFAETLTETKPPATSTYEWPGAAADAPTDPTLDWAAPSTSPSPAPTPTQGRVRVVPRPAVVGPVAQAPTSHASAEAPVVLGPADGTAAHAPAAPGDTVVQPGDSLWSIAARSLGPGASPAQVAQAWPQWWNANRDVIGDHPELIHPGDHLASPVR